MGVLDDAIAGAGPTRIVTSRRLDRLLASFKDAGMPASDIDRLVGMIHAPVEEWGHTVLVRVLRSCAAELGVNGPDAERLNYKDVEDYRKAIR